MVRRRGIVAGLAAVALAACAPNPETTPSPTADAGAGETATVTEIVDLRAPTPGFIDVIADGTPGTLSATSDGQELGEMVLVGDGERVSGQIASPVYGPQTFCLGDVCGRVAVKDPDTQSEDEARGVASEALADVLAATGADAAFPDWTFVMEGPRTGAGGSANLATRTVTIHATPGRTYEEYTVTVLHEIGHVIDFAWMNDALRAEYRDIRGLPSDAPWLPAEGEHATGSDRWNYGAEDFAEVAVALLSDGEHEVRTDGYVAPPSPAQLDRIAVLIPGLHELDTFKKS